VKPPFPYYGGKILIGPKIAGLLPPHSHYVEPFAGSLAVLFAKAQSPHETVNDLDGDLMAFWRVLREQPEDLARVCALTPHSRGEWEACVDLDVPDDVERARRLWVRLTQSRTGRLRRAGWRHYVDPAAGGTGMPAYLAGYLGRFAPAVERLHHVSLECRPAAQVIEKYGARSDVLLYVDPPYLGTTRHNDKAYRHELMKPDDHRELAELLRAARAGVVLSGYPSDLYDLELYPDWRRVEIPSSTGQGGTWQNRTEVLWSNRPLAADLKLFEAVGAWACRAEPADRV
jgi:DNA adenine methylase